MTATARTLQDRVERILAGKARALLSCGDSLKLMQEIPDESLDSVVCDPPYGLSDPQAKREGRESSGGFMGKSWDSDVPKREYWRECFRALKPGGYLIAMGGTRTYHVLATVIESAGFNIRDTICWHYGQGFPKSLDISKAIDKRLGARREQVRITNVRNPKVIKGGHEVKGGLVLDPFCGSGSTICAAMLEGARAIGFDQDARAITISSLRVKHYMGKPAI